MSLKSFDKFCERLILAEPGSQKEIFDERQNVMRSRLAIEALFIYVGLTFLNSMVMEIFYQWAESWMTVTLLFAVICLLWWEIRCALKGCLLAVSGRHAQKYSAVTVIFIGVLNGLGMCSISARRIISSRTAGFRGILYLRCASCC